MANEVTKRFEITWYGKWLAYVVAIDADMAKRILINTRGYSYYTAEVLEAREISFPVHVDAFGNRVPS
jgi:hypothetical protein